MGSSDGVGRTRRRDRDVKSHWSWSRSSRAALQVFLGASIMGLARHLGEGLASEISERLMTGIHRTLTSLGELELEQPLMLVVWAAELIMGSVTMFRLRNVQDRRFARTLAAYCVLTCAYYLLLCGYGRKVVPQLDLRHVLLIGMSWCLFDLAGQNKRLHRGAYAVFYGLLLAFITASARGSLLLQVHFATFLAVFAAALAGWSWRERLSPVALFFWCVFVGTLAFRSKTILASDDWNLLYFSLLNSRWVTLSERCRLRHSALRSAASSNCP